jgi:hypothetical protein
LWYVFIFIFILFYIFLHPSLLILLFVVPRLQNKLLAQFGTSAPLLVQPALLDFFVIPDVHVSVCIFFFLFSSHSFFVCSLLLTIYAVLIVSFVSTSIVSLLFSCWGSVGSVSVQMLLTVPFVMPLNFNWASLKRYIDFPLPLLHVSVSLNLFIFIFFMFIDLSGPLQSLMAQHSSLLLQAQQMEFALTQYCCLLATFVWDFRLMQTQHGSDRLAQFGLANSAANIDAFADFLGCTGFSEDEASYSAQLSVAQDSYSHILSFLQPLLPSLFNSPDSIPSLPISEPSPSPGLPAVPFSDIPSVFPAVASSSTQSVPVVSGSVIPPVPAAAPAALSSSAAVPAASS